MRHKFGNYLVELEEAFMGPILWSPVHVDSFGQLQAEPDKGDPQALPPPQSEAEVAKIGMAIVASQLQDEFLPELSRRVGESVDVDTFMNSPSWQSMLEKAQVVWDQSDHREVRLNDEVVFPVPPGVAHVTLIRNGTNWKVIGDWSPGLSSNVQDALKKSVGDVVGHILAGDEASTKQLVDSMFPLEKDRTVEPLYEEMPKEVYALLFRDRKTDPLDLLAAGFKESRNALLAEYEWENVKAQSLGYEGLRALQFDLLKRQLDHLCERAQLSPREMRVARVELVLAIHGDEWHARDKAKRLDMSRGNYGEALSNARQKLAKAAKLGNEPAIIEGYRRLHRMIFPGVDKTLIN